MNPVSFVRMAHGDTVGWVEIAFEYFKETRSVMARWKRLVDAGDFERLREDLHRCKGGASLFGLERLVDLIGDLERASLLENRELELTVFESELTAAENAVRELADSLC